MEKKLYFDSSTDIVIEDLNVEMTLGVCATEGGCTPFTVRPLTPQPAEVVTAR